MSAEYHTALKALGWKKKGEHNGLTTYSHPKHPGHSIHVGEGSWQHFSSPTKHVADGSGAVSKLYSHLSKRLNQQYSEQFSEEHHAHFESVIAGAKKKFIHGLDATKVWNHAAEHYLNNHEARSLNVGGKGKGWRAYAAAVMRHYEQHHASQHSEETPAKVRQDLSKMPGAKHVSPERANELLAASPVHAWHPKRELPTSYPVR